MREGGREGEGEGKKGKDGSKGRREKGGERKQGTSVTPLRIMEFTAPVGLL